MECLRWLSYQLTDELEVSRGWSWSKVQLGLSVNFTFWNGDGAYQLKTCLKIFKNANCSSVPTKVVPFRPEAFRISMWTATELISGFLLSRLCLNVQNFSSFTAALILLRFTVKADFSDVKVAFYYSPTSAKYELFSLDAVDQIFTRKAFNASKKTVLYIHGYQQNLSSATNILMVEAFIKRRTHNILALDWSAYASGNYITNAVPNLIQVSWPNALGELKMPQGL